MLGFTKHEFPSRHKQKHKAINVAIGVAISITLVILTAMFDSYFLQRTKPFISPLQRNDLQNCVMSYSYATYTDIEDVDSKFNTKYRLKLFRDGYRDDNRLYGRPALFIPGQAGSYGQVRSLASTATNTFHDNRQHGRNIDFFTVDLNEELSALNGQNLLDQAEFLNAAIDRIINLYLDPKPKSVMIIGHSMGGIVARVMPMLPNYRQNSINTIITISTPHLAAPLLLDSITYRTYTNMNQFWRQYQSTVLMNTTLISIAGGSLDNIIHSDSVNIDSLIPGSHGFTTYTTSIPNVWTGSDHMAILWCNQFIQILATTLLEVVDSSSVQERMKIFKYNLLEGGSASLVQGQKINSDINGLTKKTILPSNESSVQLIFSTAATESSITLIDASQNLQILTNIQQQHDSRWSIVLCKGSSPEKLKCDYLKPKVTILPSATAENLVGSNPYRLLEISKKQKEGYSYIGIIDHGGHKIVDGDSTVFMKAYSISESPVVHTSSIWDILRKGAHINTDTYSSLHVFPFIRNSLFALNVHVKSIKGTNQQTLFKPMMQQAINGRELKYYRGLEEGVSDRVTFHQETGKDSEGLSLRFYLDIQNVDLDIAIDWYATLGRSVLRYETIMATFLWMITLVVLLSQSYSYIANGKSSFAKFQISLFNCLRTAILQLAILLLLTSIIQLCTFTWLEEYPFFTSMSKYILFGSDDWIMIGMVLFAFALTIGLTLVIWLAVSAIVYLLSIPLCLFPNQNNPNKARDRNKYFMIHLTITVGALAFIPSTVVFIFYFIFWLFMTASAHRSATSDLPTIQNIYNYRLSWLLFLTSFLPYSVPSLIAFVKDLLIGWMQHDISITVLVQDLPILLTIIYLITIGKSPDHLEAKLLYPMIYIMNTVIIYQALFGFLHPFLSSFLI